MRSWLVVAVVVGSVSSANAFKADTSHEGYRVQTSDVIGTDIRPYDLDGAFADAGVAKPLGKCVGTDRMIGWVEFQNGAVKSVQVGGAKVRTLESCIANALRKARISTKTRVVATLVIESSSPPLVQSDQPLGRSYEPVGDRPRAGEIRPEVTVKLSSPTGKLGGFTVGEIDRVMRSRLGVYRACYQKEINRTPALAGALDVTFPIADDGTVSTVTLAKTTMNNDAVEKCITANITRLKFPTHPAAPSVGYTLTFALAK
ncbi:MAG TPA: AgmX/PglI C-terminal domain-containing protein [Kofleriaceae bacterium]|jgi:hypothetical protein